jgi:hypothetical protein
MLYQNNLHLDIIQIDQNTGEPISDLLSPKPLKKNCAKNTLFIGEVLRKFFIQSIYNIR